MKERMPLLPAATQVDPDPRHIRRPTGMGPLAACSFRRCQRPAIFTDHGPKR
jgi:hypothetical protein